MTFFKNAPARVRPDHDAPPDQAGSDGVMIMVLALIFAPIIAAHIACTFGLGEATAAPAAIERSVGTR